MCVEVEGVGDEEEGGGLSLLRCPQSAPLWHRLPHSLPSTVLRGGCYGAYCTRRRTKVLRD